MSLALLVPVRNDAQNLARLLTQARAMRLFDQVIVVDDASDTPIALAEDTMGSRSRTMVLRQDSPGGAGAARNIGLTVVDCDHVIFFDSDDLFTPEFADLWYDLEGQNFDFCLMRYQDSERGFFGGWGQNPYDESCWARAGQVSAMPCEVQGVPLWTLAEAGNFPWNKIYRTAFLRDNNLRCTETRVHNDVALHWHSFLAAERVLVSSRIGAQHIVQPGAQRLTNLSGASRFDIFTAFEEVVERLWGDAVPVVVQQAFLRFAVRVLIWGRQMVTKDMRASFDLKVQRFLHATLTPKLYEALVHDDPVLALQLCLHLAATPESSLC